ncbi:MAG: toxin co-regulated pilus biosynthesis Q family protein [Alphaproteobacteria bacterium]|nr:toxin co-regulated pilus biosynthesis Q family protein [Alphaproteobacteria bacterium]
MRLNLLKTTTCVAILSCSLGITGCTRHHEENFTSKPVCLSDNQTECVTIVDSQATLYLPEFSEQTYTVTTTQPPLKKEVVQTTYYGSQNGTDLSISSPSEESGKKVTITTPAPIDTDIHVVKPEPQPTLTETVIEKTIIEETVAEDPNADEIIAEEPNTDAPITNESVEEETPMVQTIETKTVETTQIIEEEKTISTLTSDNSLTAKVAYGEKCHDWEANAGDTLRTLLMKWSEKAGWTVIWKLDRDYHLEAGVIFRGTYTEVSGALIRSFARATPAPIGTFYKGNRVLVINTQENENAN